MTVIGPIDQVGLFMTKSQAPRPRTGDKPEYDKDGRQVNFNYKDEPMPDRIAFDFHGVVPLPKEYGETPYSVHEGAGGYEMECLTWGVKWGPYNVQDTVVDHGRVTYVFTTAWSAPMTYLRKASAAFPDLMFFVSWSGESSTWGRIMVLDGDIHHLTNDSYHDLPEIDYYYDTHMKWIDDMARAKKKEME